MSISSRAKRVVELAGSVQKVASVMPKKASRVELQKLAFLGLGRNQPMYRRPQGLGRGQARRAQQMRNIEDEFMKSTAERPAAFHPMGPVVANRHGLGTGDRAVDASRAYVKNLKAYNKKTFPQGHNPAVSMDFTPTRQMRAAQKPPTLQPDPMYKAILDAGYGQAQADKLHSQMQARFGKGNSAAKQAAVQRVIAYMQRNPKARAVARSR